MIPYAEVIGDPIAHSRSPVIHSHWLKELGVEGRYQASRVKLADLPSFLQGRRGDPDWRGCNVAMPLKSAASSLVDELNPVARRIGALNTIVRDEAKLLGLNTDWQAIAHLLDKDGLREKRVTIIGAGGAARAALEVMRQADAARVDLITRSPERAKGLLAEFGLSGDAIELGETPTADLLVNASPLGMAGYPALALDLSGIPADGTVFDMIYSPSDTLLLNAARHRGLRTVDGMTMLVHQAALAFTYFFGRTPDPDSPGLRGKLTS